jgi:hypothetical protein
MHPMSKTPIRKCTMKMKASSPQATRTKIAAGRDLPKSRRPQDTQGDKAHEGRLRVRPGGEGQRGRAADSAAKAGCGAGRLRRRQAAAQVVLP